jgi:transcriptional regulator PpsR
VSTPRARTRPGKPKADAAARGPQPFHAPAKSLEALDAADAATLIAAASDIALVIDRRGVIEDLAASIEDLPRETYAGWIGRPWSEVVTPESRDKVQALLHDAAEPQKRRLRHVNHPVAAGGDFPVMYSAVPVGRNGRVVAFGRDMRALARLQQRLVEAQHALERDYWRLRNVETRYRLLFDQASEAIVIVDAGSRKVVEANPAVKEILGLEARRLLGQVFPTGLPDRAQRELAALLDRVRASGRSEEASIRTAAPRRLELQATASLFVQDDIPLLLVRLRPQGQAGAAAGAGRQALAQLVERAPDGFVVTDTEGRVVMANAAFVGLTQLAAEDQLRGESLDRWLGRPGLDLNVMLATLRQQGSLRLFAATMHGQHGADAEVEISGVAVPDADPPCMGFTVRHVGRRLGADPAAGKSAPRSVEQLTQLVGRMPLKDLVRESTDLIERLCIEAALQLTQGNRASAAEMLGLSRQSLYVKLRRYGMSDASADAD